MLKLYPKRELHIKAAYSSDISEPGNSRFAGYPVLIDPSAFRHFLTYRMDKTLTQSLALSFRPARFIHTEFGLAHLTKTPQYGYAYAENTGGTGKPLALRTAFEYTEAEISFRYSHNEKFTLLRGYRVLTENGYPMLYISYAHGFNGLLNGNYTYNRFNIRLQHQLVSSFLGTSSVQLDAGFIDAALPYPLLFNGRGTKFGGLPLLVPNYFQTMDLYAFTTDRFVSLLLSHNFGNLLFNGKNFKPEWVIVHNLLFGSLKNPSAHTGIETLAPTKGYFEAGLLLNNLLRYNYVNVARIGFGGGLFYRYGTYSKLNFTDNLSPVLSVVLRF